MQNFGACGGGSLEPVSRAPPPLQGSRDGHPRWADGQGCMRGEGTPEAAPEAVRQAVGGGC